MFVGMKILLNEICTTNSYSSVSICLRSFGITIYHMLQILVFLMFIIFRAVNPFCMIDRLIDFARKNKSIDLIYSFSMHKNYIVLLLPREEAFLASSICFVRKIDFFFWSWKHVFYTFFMTFYVRHLQQLVPLTEFL